MRLNFCTYKDPYAADYEYWYPLQEWGWDREECERQIAAAGLPVPHKSSCFFCPAMKTAEVDALPYDKLQRIVLLESRAAPRLQKVEGLWRRSTKKRPGSMTKYIADKGLLPAAEIARLQSVPTGIVDFQNARAEGRTSQPFSEFIVGVLSESFAA